MLTPQEVSEKVFPRASFGGYNMASVDEFLDGLTEDYTALYKENATLKAKMKVLAEKVEEYRETEDAMRSTLLTAQKMATTLVQEAEDKKREILSSAASEALTKVADMENATRDAQQRLQLARESLGDFLRHSMELCQGQADFLRSLPEMDLQNTAEATAVTEEKGEDTAVFQIENNILNNYGKAHVEETPAPGKSEPDKPVQPEETAAVEEKTETKTGEDPFAAGFKLDLNELKFGRNYSTDPDKK